ncbi:MAG: alpha/beta hydrolase [Clostridia bacterium]|nr:alpha/beta hydrolase [Clostridia bacterium]
MFFDKNNYSDETAELGGEKVSFRAYRNIVFVDNPADDTFHRMNIYAPLSFFNGKNVNGYNLHTAPIFMPNAVGGYRPGKIEEPSTSKTVFRALLHGCVVVSPAIRGRTLKDKNGKNYGCAPACIVDYKAAARFLHYFASDIPGDAEKIITNGTSAGGALSCLIGSTGNHPDYDKYLKEIGAADASDSVFAASCYCPITNLDNADMAYEWQFDGVYDCHRHKMILSEGGRPYFTPVDDVMNDERIQISKELSARFPDYINSLKLTDGGKALTLDKDGDGSFKDYIKSIVLASAQMAIDAGENLSSKSWLKIENGRAADMDFTGYARDITRMKTAPAFDDITMDSAENNLFGDSESDFKHFTKYSLEHGNSCGNMADSTIIKMLNPMYYTGDDKAQKARYFRIRHGERDRDTSLAISAILNLKLKEAGCNVDYFSPWDTPHSGDYDLPDLFAWIDSIVKK